MNFDINQIGSLQHKNRLSDDQLKLNVDSAFDHIPQGTRHFKNYEEFKDLINFGNTYNTL